ncbi:MAG: hypothetical protein M9894_07395 [Planctomycetes bacterium]|nr:hypothetical protein [Planctomycetota bacterium]
MGACYGLGLVGVLLEADAPREEKVAAVQAHARAASTTLRDAFDGVAVEVSPDGAVTELAGDLARDVREAVERAGGSASYSTFKYLDGFVVCADGAREAEVELPGGGDGYVGPLEALALHLDELLAREGVDPACHALHGELRALCDRGRALRLPVTLGP